MSTEKKEKRILLVGRSGCGKTTLADTITHGSATYHKTQANNESGKLHRYPLENIWRILITIEALSCMPMMRT